MAILTPSSARRPATAEKREPSSEVSTAGLGLAQTAVVSSLFQTEPMAGETANVTPNRFSLTFRSTKRAS